ncbi:MAG: DUF6544 family protein [Saprospiraceae bacterium]|nr:DUF6544 family protein [Saprospiraceae bacterium]MDZ4704962.1 DUF6544 family protein [Saprospiraceae bacterium]
MLKFIFIAIALIHGLIHFMGFAKAFGYGNTTQLTKEISKPAGVFWMLTAWLFIAVVALFLFKIENWWALGIIAAVVSQVLIFSIWQDAKFGTIANVLVLVVSLLSMTNVLFERSYKKDVNINLERTRTLPPALLTESDIQGLPPLVQKYLRYSGVLNKPKVYNMRVIFEGEMRDKNKDWFPFRSEQFNFFDEPTRLFFRKGKMFGIVVPGYHRYSDATATMNIRLFGMFPIVKQSGAVMNKTETVTLFNDMCLMAPATLIDPRITWKTIDATSVEATFANKGITISAILYFNEQGQLTNFTSNDRTSVSQMQTFLFSTPVSEYQTINGINMMKKGDAVWHYPEGEFVYGKFLLKAIEYNCP